MIAKNCCIKSEIAAETRRPWEKSPKVGLGKKSAELESRMGILHVASWIAKKEASLGKLNGLKQKINEQQIEREISLEDYRLFVVDKSAKKRALQY